MVLLILNVFITMKALHIDTGTISCDPTELAFNGCLYLRASSPSLGDLMLQLGNRGNIVLYSKTQLCITSSIDSIFLQLFSEWFLSVNPTKTL